MSDVYKNISRIGPHPNIRYYNFIKEWIERYYGSEELIKIQYNNYVGFGVGDTSLEKFLNLKKIIVVEKEEVLKKSYFLGNIIADTDLSLERHRDYLEKNKIYFSTAIEMLYLLTDEEFDKILLVLNNYLDQNGFFIAINGFNKDNKLLNTRIEEAKKMYNYCKEIDGFATERFVERVRKFDNLTVGVSKLSIIPSIIPYFGKNDISTSELIQEYNSHDFILIQKR